MQEILPKYLNTTEINRAQCSNAILNVNALLKLFAAKRLYFLILTGNGAEYVNTVVPNILKSLKAIQRHNLQIKQTPNSQHDRLTSMR